MISLAPPLVKEQIRPIRYKIDWDKINLSLYIGGMVPVVYEKIAEHMKMQISEAERSTSTSWDGNYRMVKIKPQFIPCEEIQKCVKTLGYGRCKWVNFMYLPAGYELFTHADKSRKCAINFVKDITANPFIFNGKKYGYDRFLFNCTVPHSVPVGTDRISMQLAFHDYEYDEIHRMLSKDGWV